MQRLFVDHPLATAAEIPLTAGQAHYLGAVMRLGPGAAVMLFNGRDGEWQGRITALAKKAGTVVAETCRRPQAAEPDPWLVFAPIKGPRLDFVVEKAVELGAAALVPVLTRRTVVSRVNTERMQAQAIEAAEQCERLTLPAVHAPVPLERLLAAWPAGRRLIVLDERGAVPPLAQALRDLPPAPAALLAGPEGGFDQTELDALQDLPFVTRVTLGPRILRAETAALAALACWQALCGDWSSAGSARPSPSRH